MNNLVKENLKEEDFLQQLYLDKDNGKFDKNVWSDLNFFKINLQNLLKKRY